MDIKRRDKSGVHRVAFEKNKKRLLKTQTNCGICGRLIDKNLKYPDRMSAVIDHIVPLSKGGHPSDISNLQIAHWICNRQKSDKLFTYNIKTEPKILSNRMLPQSKDWSSYKSD